MKSVQEFVKSSHDNLEGRENIEWANYWYSNADNSISLDSKRILLIGDSTVRLIRSTFERVSKRPVDMIGTSCGLNDVLFLSQVQAFFISSQYKYKTIFIQLGHHSIKNEHGDNYSNNDYNKFRADYIALVEFLTQYCNNIVLLTCFLNVSELPKWAKGRLGLLSVLLWRKIAGEKIDWTWSDVVSKKNEIILEIAKEHGYKYCDIDGIMRNNCKGMFPKYIHRDHIHYEGKAKVPIVMEYMKYL